VAVVGSLVVQVKADARGVRPGVQSATNQMNAFTSNTKKGQAALASFGAQASTTGMRLKGLAGPLAGIVSVSLALRHFRSEAERLDKIGKISVRLGIGVEELSGLQFAAERSGIAVAQFNMGLQRMTRRMSEAANGTGEAKDAIRELGLDAKALRDAGPGEALLQVADALAKIKNPTDRLRLAFKLFDSEGVSMLQLFGDGRRGVEEMLAKARELGITVDQEIVDKFTKMNDKVSDMKKAWSAMGTEIEAVAAGPVTKLAEGLTDAAKVVERLGGADASGPEVLRQLWRRLTRDQPRIADVPQKVTDRIARARAARANALPEVVRGDPSAAMRALMERAQAARETIRGNAEKFLQSLQTSAASALRALMSPLDMLKQQTETLGKLLLNTTITQKEYKKGVEALTAAYKLGVTAQRKARVEQIRLANETPLEAFRRQAKEVASLVGPNGLSVEEGAKELFRLRKELLSPNKLESPEPAGALEQGSAAAFSRIMEIERGGDERRRAQEEREKQTEWQRQMTEWLERIFGRVEGAPV